MISRLRGGNDWPAVLWTFLSSFFKNGGYVSPFPVTGNFHQEYATCIGKMLLGLNAGGTPG